MKVEQAPQKAEVIPDDEFCFPGNIYHESANPKIGELVNQIQTHIQTTSEVTEGMKSKKNELFRQLREQQSEFTKTLLSGEE